MIQGSYLASKQLCLQIPPRIEVLRSSQILERLGDTLNLHQIKIGNCIAHQNYRIWHKGKNSWELIRID
jgi:hypothetical protein